MKCALKVLRLITMPFALTDMVDDLFELVSISKSGAVSANCTSMQTNNWTYYLYHYLYYSV